MSTQWGLRIAITEAIKQSEEPNKGYSDEYKKGWEDACAVIEKKLRAAWEAENPRTIG